MKKIPKIIHQIWLGENPKPVKLMQTWKDKHPDYKFFEWNNETIKKMKFRCQKQIDQMIGAGRFNGAADLIRYEVLYELGGFVAPADSVCLNSIDDLLENTFFCCYENEKVRPGLISPHIGCRASDNFIKNLVDILSEKEDVLYDEPWKVTGNLLLTEWIEKQQGNILGGGFNQITILPSHTFIPDHYTGEKYEGDGKIYARHFWGSTKQITNKLDEQI